MGAGIPGTLMTHAESCGVVLDEDICVRPDGQRQDIVPQKFRVTSIGAPGTRCADDEYALLFGLFHIAVLAAGNEKVALFRLLDVETGGEDVRFAVTAIP